MDFGLGEDIDALRETVRKFAQEEISPRSAEVDRSNDFPMELWELMGNLGLHGITISEEYGGVDMGYLAHCVAVEEISRANAAIGMSYGAHSNLCVNQIYRWGNAQQKNKYLPEIASGNILTTAVFTEPNTGSDLGNLSTRAQLDGDSYIINGNKTWITHGARSDLMTVLARTDSNQKGYRGLSMFLVDKPRGNCENPFPMEGMSGSEIEVLGYRGMKEYEIALDSIKVSKKNLLGEEEGKGFKQLMETFESARIQTAARAVGVSQNALELGLQYAKDRSQFGKSIIKFSRIYNKLA